MTNYLFIFACRAFFSQFFAKNCYDQHSRSVVKSNCVHCTLLHTHFLYCVAFYQNAIARMKQNLRENAKFRVSGLFFGESNSHVHEKKAFTFMISVSNLWFYGAEWSFAANCIYAQKKIFWWVPLKLKFKHFLIVENQCCQLSK